MSRVGEQGMGITGREHSMHPLRPRHRTGLAECLGLVCEHLWEYDSARAGWGRLSQLCKALPTLTHAELTLKGPESQHGIIWLRLTLCSVGVTSVPPRTNVKFNSTSCFE